MIYLLSILSGFLLSLSTPPMPSGPLIWIAFVPLFIAFLSAGNYRQALLSGALAGIILHGFLFYGLKNYSAGIYLLLIPLYSIPFILLSSFTFYISRKSSRPLAVSIVIASFWLLVEHVMNVFSLPYCTGLFLYHSSWAGFVSLVGCSGLGALIIFANVFLVLSLTAGRISLKTAVIWVLVVWAPFLYGRVYSARPIISDSSLKIAVVQPNWSPKDYVGKEQHSLWRQMSQFIKEAALKTSADVILLPESFGVYPGRENYLDDISDLPAVDIISGGVNYSPDRLSTYNSVYHIKPRQGIVSVYNKVGLVPLIESAYAVPKQDTKTFSIGSHMLAPLVCFESLIESRVKEQAEKSEGLLLLANEAWFETKTLPFTHLASMVMRSIEHGMPAVMVGNTLSMVSDATGRFQVTDYRAHGIVVFDFHPGRIETPFSKYGGIMPYLAGLVVFGAIAARRSEK